MSRIWPASVVGLLVCAIRKTKVTIYHFYAWPQHQSYLLQRNIGKLKKSPQFAGMELGVDTAEKSGLVVQ